jgi:YHS domain-containing protein
VTRVVLLFALLAVVAWAFWRFVDGVIDTFGGLPRDREARARQGRRGGPAVKLARDPVCGTWIDPGASLAATAGGTTHYFCSTKCRDEFRRAS